MARSALVILSIAAFVAVGAKELTFTDVGMQMSGKAYEYVCWYENLKQLYPGTSKTEFGTCNHAIDQLVTYWSKQEGYPEETIQQGFADNLLEQKVMEPPHITSGFGSACNQYLKTPKMAPAPDANKESEALNDANKDSPYPFKGFAYCLIQQLRKTYGQKAIDAVIEKRTKPSHWLNVINDRENEYRALHGVPALRLDARLSKDAQEYAEKIASDCLSSRPHPRYPHSEHKDREVDGKPTGENIFSSGAHEEWPPIKQEMALAAANNWYSEIQYYNYATGKSNVNGKAVGHFTQSVWKNSDSAGYGYAYNPKCKGPLLQQVVIIARYSPPGNYGGQHKENVFPPK